MFQRTLSDMLVLNTSGNHDTGKALNSDCVLMCVGIGQWWSRKTFRRYEDHFGPSNYKVQINDWTLISICATCIAHNIGPITEETLQFIRSFENGIIYFFISVHRTDYYDIRHGERRSTSIVLSYSIVSFSAH